MRSPRVDLRKADTDKHDKSVTHINAKKQTLGTQLEDSNIYNDANKDKLKALLLDQAYLVKELGQVEADWLEQQEFLEAVG